MVYQYFQIQNRFRSLPANSKVPVVNVGKGDNLETTPATHLDVIPGQFNLNTETKPEAGVITPLLNRAVVLQ
jgi:hypothetical protein